MGEPMSSMLGSEFETSLRILLLLQAIQGETMTEGAIAALDFITVYSRDFNVTDSNLHGDSTYRFGEFATRREAVKRALKQLVMDGLIGVSSTTNGFTYKLSDEGLAFVSALNSEYADAYYEIAIQAIAVMGKSERKLINIINQQALASLRRE